VTEDLTWTENGSYNTRPSSKEHHIKTWQYLTLAIVTPCPVPLMSIPYRQIDNLDSLVIELLEYLKTLPLKIELVLFDRGFYQGSIIDYLENCRGKSPLPYLILAKQSAIFREHITLTNHFGWFTHQMVYSKNKTKWKPKTTIVIWKPDPIVRPDLGFTYATNLKPFPEIAFIYPLRWGIETLFRVHDEAGIKSKSSHPLVRYFYHMVGMLFAVLWRAHSETSKHLVFKRYLDSVYEAYLKQIDEPDPPPLISIY
jgi:hypothetical protein